MADRSEALAQWARREAGVAAGDWQIVSGDASFRRYFRLRDGKRSWIAVDAPPERENAGHFVALSNALRERGLPTPAVYAADLNQGFLLLEDFGDSLLLAKLTPQSVAGLYGDAMNLLAQWQAIAELPVSLPRYEPARLKQEMELFPSWLLERHLQRPFEPAEQQQYERVMHLLLANASAQPFVLCHRDFHSRNLMLRPGFAVPGLIDFQDAVWGPVTYDLVSLLRDCYIEWPATQVRDWALKYRDRYVGAGGHAVDDATWLRWFDWMGLQRHLKVLGIFARLHYRDGKRGYLADLPLTLRYCINVAEQYDELQAFAVWLRQQVASRLDATGQVKLREIHS
ncbi:phosphotransferase [Permianibacter sp. IMCC34836]|uniref:aminoglycoside phosphotransferase family protein n=1 Tax=Permianibacter fluminis TaxID=2738515 RepID=UPI00155715BB|nr:phosphotransferase [Permianibacter fluminis]NQD36904.1 phosphotransferase [Permianibacter fluminis]